MKNPNLYKPELPQEMFFLGNSILYNCITEFHANVIFTMKMSQKILFYKPDHIQMVLIHGCSL